MQQNWLKAIVALFTAWMSTGALASERADIAWQMIREGALLVDVRTVEEYAQGHLDNALNWPLSEVETAFQSIAKIGRLWFIVAAVIVQGWLKNT